MYRKMMSTHFNFNCNGIFRRNHSHMPHVTESTRNKKQMLRIPAANIEIKIDYHGVIIASGSRTENVPISKINNKI